MKPSLQRYKESHSPVSNMKEKGSQSLKLSQKNWQQMQPASTKCSNRRFPWKILKVMQTHSYGQPFIASLLNDSGFTSINSGLQLFPLGRRTKRQKAKRRKCRKRTVLIDIILWLTIIYYNAANMRLRDKAYIILICQWGKTKSSSAFRARKRSSDGSTTPLAQTMSR